jgi:nucleoside-diphosphate-sugar epimerase
MSDRGARAAGDGVAPVSGEPTIAITGAAGFIGSRLSAALAAAGRPSIGFDLVGGPSVRVLDIRRPIDAGELVGVSVAVHLAAATGVRPSLVDPDHYHETNVVGTANFVLAAQRAGVRRLVLASSSSVYGECEEPAEESAALRPLSPYGASKAGAEDAAMAAASHLEIAVARPFTVYGPGQRSDMLLAKILRGEPMVLWPFRRDFTYIDEVVAGLLALIDMPLTTSPFVVNLSSGRPQSADDVRTAVAELVGSRTSVRIDRGLAHPGEPMTTWGSPGRAQAILGLSSARSFQDGLRQQANH